MTVHLSENGKKALQAAVNAIYFDDNSDFITALYEVVRHLSKISEDDLDEDVIDSLYHELNEDL